MILCIKTSTSIKEFNSNSFLVTQNDDEIEILENHEDIIYVIKNGIVKINNEEINIKDGILQIVNNKASILC
ncbi:hypothetical protein [Candidatus Deianiraea vastatrix]|uniref:ATP synthase epsilon chain n=1 Tax=Candidatus Deianiraea vastatrix TaxID=2163644 RepID=A0A5B8XEH5_9RICK|nr:hypothetical protein [Candidatus Deianiraea vastatrix]QED23376.1 ATP synthase epsilon chain [Candidatus Deianiraea vastatrix]